ncbi:MAG: class I SAM-dependent methyltransferase [Candidatus Staskawiczbacteria bacterium]|nr:class I SAM-dependent methyltransferase [Candidatus Staskawiczbacteria bacterium]
MANFQKYADFYDKVYENKDYKKEADFLKNVIKKYSSIKVGNILSLGCGTASHDIILAKSGFKILGVDKSPKMIEIAKQKAKKENADIKFKIADISNFKAGGKFDFAMAMFNTLGYMAENEAMENTIKNTGRLLKKNALFAFDCWYGPAVLKNRPEDREKTIGGFIRKTGQKLDIEKSIVDINFKIFKDGIIKINENHKIRFWYLPELEYFFAKNGFKIIKICNFMDLNSKISEDNWNIFIVAKKI